MVKLGKRAWRLQRVRRRRHRRYHQKAFLSGRWRELIKGVSPLLPHTQKPWRSGFVFGGTGGKNDDFSLGARNLLVTSVAVSISFFNFWEFSLSNRSPTRGPAENMNRRRWRDGLWKVASSHEIGGHDCDQFVSLAMIMRDGTKPKSDVNSFS